MSYYTYLIFTEYIMNRLQYHNADISKNYQKKVYVKTAFKLPQVTLDTVQPPIVAKGRFYLNMDRYQKTSRGDPRDAYNNEDYSTTDYTYYVGMGHMPWESEVYVEIDRTRGSNVIMMYTKDIQGRKKYLQVNEE